jgi:hypothetical protein
VNPVIKISFAKVSALIAAAVLGASLSGCGGAAPGVQTPTTGPAAPTAATLDITLNKSSIRDIDADSATVTVRALDSSNRTVSGVSVSVAVDSGVFTAGAAGSVTDANGQVTGTLTVGANKANRVITITATSVSAGATIKKTAGIAVTGAALSATVLSAQPVLSGGQVQIKFSLKDANGSALTGMSLTATSSLSSFPPVTGTTDTNGEYLLTYTVATISGQQTDVITASAGGATPLSPPTVQLGSGPAPTPSGTPAKISLQANPAVVAVNASIGSSANRAGLQARVLTSNDQVVLNAPVQFRIVNGSQFGALAFVDAPVAPATTNTTIGTVLTDAFGTATNNFVPGAFGSSQNGVLVCAKVVTNATVTPSNPNALCAADESGVLLTVSQQALSVTIGFDNTISNGQGGLTYVRKFAVLVTDVAGNPVNGADVSWTVDPQTYIKGSLVYCGSWVYAGTCSGGAATVVSCPNEDANRNGNLDTGEDINGNNQLDPRIPISLSGVGGVSKTDASGYLQLQLEYAENYAPWAIVKITVSTLVGQSEGRATLDYVLSGMSSDFTDQNNPPAGVRSPFGIASTCTNPN